MKQKIFYKALVRDFSKFHTNNGEPFWINGYFYNEGKPMSKADFKADLENGNGFTVYKIVRMEKSEWECELDENGKAIAKEAA